MLEPEVVVLLAEMMRFSEELLAESDTFVEVIVDVVIRPGGCGDDMSGVAEIVPGRLNKYF